jgi:hypothetical protein
MQLSAILKKIKAIDFKRIFLKVFVGKSKFFVLALATFLLVYCGYIWYAYFFASNWNNEKKEEYIRKKSAGEVVFREEKFKKIMDKIEERKNKYQETIEVDRDIFGLK